MFLIEWVMARLIPLGIGAVGIVALWVSVENSGAQKYAAKLEKRDNAAAANIRKADSLSRNSTARSVRDPNSVSQ